MFFYKRQWYNFNGQLWLKWSVLVQKAETVTKLIRSTSWDLACFCWTFSLFWTLLMKIQCFIPLFNHWDSIVYRIFNGKNFNYTNNGWNVVFYCVYLWFFLKFLMLLLVGLLSTIHDRKVNDVIVLRSRKTYCDRFLITDVFLWKNLKIISTDTNFSH